MPRIHLYALLLLLLLVFGQVVNAADRDQEIQHLLGFIEQSRCTFQRNGKQHTSPEAREHIQKKYDYLRDRLDTTEDFIAHAASRSSFSGSPYYVTCNGNTRTSENWLSEELLMYRADQEP